MTQKLPSIVTQYRAYAVGAKCLAGIVAGAAFKQYVYYGHQFFSTDTAHSAAAQAATKAAGAATFSALFALVLAFLLPYVVNEAYLDGLGHLSQWRQTVARVTGRLNCGITAGMSAWMLLLALLPLLNVGGYLRVTP